MHLPEHSSPITISRTIYDPDTKDFVTSTPDAKALPNIKQWIKDHNPVIYWYVLRIDNSTDADISQWAVELYAPQALTITEAYIDDSARRFELRKVQHDPWTEKCVLSINRQIGIPIVGKGIRRIFFKVDINCKEGLMHEYGISGKFILPGLEPVEIKEKMFKYSCKVGEFKQIFNKDPHEASHYAEKKLAGKYQSNVIHIFTNSFRIIHELTGICHLEPFDRDALLQKLHLLKVSFEGVPEIAGERISPFLDGEIYDLNNILSSDNFTRRSIKLCDALVELLHMEVMGAEMNDAGAYIPPAEPVQVNAPAKPQFNGNNRVECPTCHNFITESNKSLICTECSTQFCTTCEGWFRGERKLGEGPLCKACFVAEQERLREIAERKAQMEREKEERLERERKEKEEHEKRLKAEQAKKAREEEEHKQKEAEERERKAKEESEKLVKEGNSIGMKFTQIPAGEFMMGSLKDEEGRYNDEGPAHKVNINKPFCLGTYPVTQREWKAIMGDNYSYFKGDELPVETVSWNDVQEFIKRLNQNEGVDKYRLPSEAEWEYACRAGTTTRYSFGDDEGKLGEYAWYDGNSSNKTHPVGQKKPNPWGLYDMYGNVFEWTQDKWHGNYNGAQTDGNSWGSGGGSYRVYRGGSWHRLARSCRSAYRNLRDPDDRDNALGFRLLRGQ